MFFAKIKHSLLMVFSLVLFAGMAFSYAHAQSDNFPRDIDPRLIEVVEEVRLRARAPKSAKQNQGNGLSDEDAYADRRIQAAVRIQEAAYSKDPSAIRNAISEFRVIDNPQATPSMANITNLYSRHASLLEVNATLKTQQLEISLFEETGSWFERYFALHLSWYLNMESNERQAALQKAQYGFRLISDDSGQEIYSKFAKAEVLSTLSHLHNRQGNVDLAIASSLEYLKLTKGDKDAKVAIDILNNLVFSHSLTRDHKSLNYLSEELLEIEKLSAPSILGLAALRVSQVANIGGNFEKGYLFSQQAIEKTSHPAVKEQAIISQAVSLAGLGRKDEVQSLILNSDLNLDREHLLSTETRRDVIYLGFLLAQGKDEVLARRLHNRQLDVTARKFYKNSSQDTTAMVAELENSRERQAERDAAAARESRLQALTIDKQRKLNRTLKIISILLGGAALASFFFMKFRVRIVGELEEKTIEAASA